MLIKVFLAWGHEEVDEILYSIELKAYEFSFSRKLAL